MQQLGLVDAVWTEDGDAFMFGCDVLIKFHHNSNKSKTEFKVFETGSIQRSEPCLNQDGFILHAILAGGDYNMTGLKNMGQKGFLKAAKEGLASSLCKSNKSNITGWRDELMAYLDASNIKISVPLDFPSYENLKNYRSPLVSSRQNLERNFPKTWSDPLPEDTLQDFLIAKFTFDAERYVKYIVPLIIVRDLMMAQSQGEVESTGGSRNRSAKRFQVQIPPINRRKKQLPGLVEATFLVQPATSLDLAAWAKVPRQKEKFYVTPRAETLRTLEWIVKPAALPIGMKAFVTPTPRTPLATGAINVDVSKKRKSANSVGSSKPLKRPKTTAQTPNTLDNFIKRSSLSQSSATPPSASPSLGKTRKGSPKSNRPIGTAQMNKRSMLNLKTAKSQVSPPSSQTKGEIGELSSPIRPFKFPKTLSED
jgi:Holliday junction resolvase YEN1